MAGAVFTPAEAEAMIAGAVAFLGEVRRILGIGAPGIQ
jgi:hypothetical protein